jgi:hypothetical protein
MAEHPRFALDTTPLATGAAIRATTTPATTAEPATPGRMTVFVPSRNAPAGTAPRPMVPVTVDADSEFARANAALAAARANLAQQLERYTPAHPDVRSATSAVERAESRLEALAGAAPPRQTPAPAASGDTAPKPQLVRRMVSAPAPAKPATSATPPSELVALETEWLKLTRAATQARQRQDQVVAALFKADIAANSESGGRGLQMTVIDPAYRPTRPEPPGRTLIAALFVAASLVIGVIVALIRAVVDDRIFEGRDARGPAELLAEIPRPGTIRSVHVPS